MIAIEFATRMTNKADGDFEIRGLLLWVQNTEG